MHLVLATCEQQPLPADDAILIDALRDLGVTVTSIPWTEIDPHTASGAPPIVLRSTWDYHRVPGRFISWLQALDASGRTVWNDARTVQENVDKIYLAGLAAKGIAIPSTCWIERVDNDALRSTLAAQHWDRAVLKPRVAATAYGTFLIAPDARLSDDDLAPARASGALLQQFVPEIQTRGEISLNYCDGAFSHAVVKRARADDFRVQKDFGGTAVETAPSAQALAFADRVMATLPVTCLYARVDLVESDQGPMLMELELIEPELYFAVVPTAAIRFATAIVKRL
jgi:glutathione synthase/RimK-type ligase-like ATP-grasp enzyme